MNILVLNTSILAVNPVDVGNSWQTADQIIPKHVAEGAAVVDVILPDGFSLGLYEWNGTAVVQKQIAPEPISAPDVVTMRQARLALLSIGKLADVDTAINNLPSPTKEAARIEWDYATEVKRDWPLVLMLAPVLGLDSTSLDNLFITASTL